MGTDRFVYWNKRRPKREEVRLVITDYFGGFADDIQWDKHSASRGRFLVKLKWKVSNPLDNIEGAYKRPRFASDGRYIEVTDERFIEVFVDPRYVDVITRQADEATSALAEGLAAVFARFWKGRLEK